MNKEFIKYSKKVVRLIGADKRISNKIKEDILLTLESRANDLSNNNPYELMGDPKVVAEEFRVNLNLPKKDYFEYISSKEVFGIPLVHINNKRNGVAKGIIAIGAFSVGVISLGGFSIGLLSLGGFSLGLLFSIGGFSIAPLGIAIGGFAAGYSLAIGGFAYAHSLALGGFAMGDIAIGDQIDAIVGAYKTSGKGTFVYNLPEEKDKVIPAITNLYPNISKLKLWLIDKFLGI